MFEKDAEENSKKAFCIAHTHEDELIYRNGFQQGAEFGYNKANEWHFVKDGDLPKENQKCYFIYSNTYDKSNKVSFAKDIIQVRTGIYSFFLDDDGNDTTEPCFYDDIIGDEIGLSEVYAWKEIVLPELPKESYKND